MSIFVVLVLSFSSSWLDEAILYLVLGMITFDP